MELPFLYPTRTLLRSSKLSIRRVPSVFRPQPRHKCLHQRAQNDSQDQSQTSFFREKAEAVAARLGHSDISTITKEEQWAFDNLRRLAGQGQRVSDQPDDTPDAGLLSVDPGKILALFTPSGSPEAEIDLICKEYITSVSEEFKRALTSKTQLGDFAIWQVLRHRVFPLLTFLKDQRKVAKSERRLAEKALPVARAVFKAAQSQPVILAPSVASSESATTKTEEKGTDSPELASDTSSSPASSAASLAPLPILTRVYPAALLIAFRLLTRHHPMSTLTHSVLPHVRSLGASSYVLGTNTYFYNTLIFLRWNVYSSLREVCDLLSEMEQGAVEFDRRTHKTLSYIARERWSDLMQHESQVNPSIESLDDETVGSRGRQWWMQPEQMKLWARVEEWTRTIAKQLEERGMGEVIREGPWTSRGTDFGNEQNGPEVWL